MEGWREKCERLNYVKGKVKARIDYFYNKVQGQSGRGQYQVTVQKRKKPRIGG